MAESDFADSRPSRGGYANAGLLVLVFVSSLSRRAGSSSRQLRQDCNDGSRRSCTKSAGVPVRWKAWAQGSRCRLSHPTCVARRVEMDRPVEAGRSVRRASGGREQAGWDGAAGGGFV